MTPFDSRDVQALGFALVHFLWQGTALALLLGALHQMLRHAAPQVRYLLSAATLSMMLLAPLLTFGFVRPMEVSPTGLATAAGRAFGAVGETHALTGASLPLAAPGLRQRLEPVLPLVVALWGLGVFSLSLRTLGGVAVVRRLKRSGLQAPPEATRHALAHLVAALRVSTPVRLYESALVEVPTVIGWLRPVVLVPASALSGLTPHQLELILAHELAHIRRGDYLVNLLQTMVETLLFYHPAVHWVSRQMRIEREHCCDDLAVLACGSPVRYARALADLGGLCAEAPALAMAASGGSLFERIARLVGPKPSLSRASRGLAGLLVLAALALGFGAGPALLGLPAPAAHAALVLPLDLDEPLGGPAEREAPKAARAETRPLAKPAAHGIFTQEATPAPEPGPEAAPQTATEPRSEANASPKAASAAKASPEGRAFPLERILELARAGVTPEYIDEMDALGYKSLGTEQLIALRSQGIGPPYVKEMGEAGHPHLSVERLIALRAQGVSAAYLRGLKAEGLVDLSLEDGLSLRAQGVNPEFVAAMRKAGYGDLSVSKLLSLRSQGVSAPYVLELQALGYDGLTVSKLLALRAQGVTTEYVRELQGLGYRQVEVNKLLALRAQGVTPEYVRSLREAGYPDLEVGALIELRAAGVSAEFVLAMKDAGLDPLEVSDLIALRHSGVRPELLKRLKGKM